MNQEQQRWLGDYCDQTISAEAFAQFEAALEASSEFRREARRYLSMDARLQQGQESIALPETVWAGEQLGEPTKKLGIQNKRWLWYAAVAAGLVFFLGLGVGDWLKPWSDEGNFAANHEDDGIAVLKHSVDAVWENGTTSAKAAGSILSPGRIQLKSGVVEIQIYNGTQLILEGPVDVDLKSVELAVCRRGKLRAFVPPNARGFTVMSPQFELVDLGTEFGVEVSETGDASVQVFDGEVELYPPDGLREPKQLRRLLGGSGLSWNPEGEIKSIDPESGNFASFEEVKSQDQLKAEKRFHSWQAWNQSVATDPRVVVHYDFEGGASQLEDRSAAKQYGTIVGSEWVAGRWPEKGALEFRRPGDRVRINVEGEFSQLTYGAWIRMDAHTGRTQALLLTDGYDTGRPHWQISPEGILRLGVRLPSNGGSGYGSRPIFNTRRIGVWTFVSTVYDPEKKLVSHYLNGSKISSERLKQAQMLSIGSAEIGNWGVPHKPTRERNAIRNFVGRVDTFTVWSEALTAEEIRKIYLTTRP